jgi:hypothetical protein
MEYWQDIVSVERCVVWIKIDIYSLLE